MFDIKDFDPTKDTTDWFIYDQFIDSNSINDNTNSGCGTVLFIIVLTTLIF